MRRGRRRPRATRGIAIYAACRSDASALVMTEKTHWRWVTARRARRNVHQTRADTLCVRRDASKTHGPVTLHRPVGGGIRPDAFFGPTSRRWRYWLAASALRHECMTTDRFFEPGWSFGRLMLSYIVCFSLLCSVTNWFASCATPVYVISIWNFGCTPAFSLVILRFMLS
jgi:hypothetical protein